jgi:hypothetical protein
MTSIQFNFATALSYPIACLYNDKNNVTYLVFVRLERKDVEQQNNTPKMLRMAIKTCNEGMQNARLRAKSQPYSSWAGVSFA